MRSGLLYYRSIEQRPAAFRLRRDSGLLSPLHVAPLRSDSLMGVAKSAISTSSRQTPARCGRTATTMPKAREGDRIELVYGTLDLLILRTLRWGPTHGHGIAKSIERMSEDALKVDHGSLYPALQRLLQEQWVTAEWGVSENKQRAKYYRLTAAGRKKLVTETSRWERSVKAITGVLTPAGGNKRQ